MDSTSLPTTFISYSRRQLYFAEALALHLQKAGLNVWFDLQQLKAGSVWADGLKSGISNAGTLVLVVSKASLASPYVEVEWKGVLEKGNPVVLAVYESVELPEELRALPSYDFRQGFQKKLADLSAYLKGETEPRYDKVAPPNRFRDMLRTPWPVLLIVCSYFTTLLACLAVFYKLGDSDISPIVIIPPVLSLALGLWYGIPFLGRKAIYRKLRRSVLWVTLLLIIQFVVFYVLLLFQGMADSYYNQETAYGEKSTEYVLIVATLVAIVYNLLVYYLVFGWSSALLRWIGPEDDLQLLRRRSHQSLIEQELGDLNIKAESRVGDSVLFSVHNDTADQPFAHWMANIFEANGHTQVQADAKPNYHIAVLSNRTSIAQVQELIHSYAGKLIFIVASTVEFTEDLGDAGKYQWVDARDVDEEDIVGLANSLGTAVAGKKAGLESTPSKIDSWKIPSSLKLLRVILVLFAVACLLRILSDLFGNPFKDELPVLSSFSQEQWGRVALFLMLGAGSFLLIIRGLVKRKMPTNRLFLGVSIIYFFVCFLVVPYVDEFKYGSLVLFSLVFLLLTYSALRGRTWLPAAASANNDEVGMNAAISRTRHIKHIGIVILWIALYFGVLFLNEYKYLL